MDKSEIPCRFKFCKHPCTISDMLRQKESPANGRRKVVIKISCGFVGVFSIVLCISRFLSEKSSLRGSGKLGTKRVVKCSKGTWHQIKIRERKELSQGIFQKCAPHERSF